MVINMNLKLFGCRSRRRLVFTAVTVLLIAVLVGANFVLSLFVPDKSIYFDMTSEGLYSLSAAMKKETEFIGGLDKKVEIIFCNDRDRLIASQATRVTYFMALQLQERYPDNVEVRTVNPTLNPTALAKYKTTSLTEISTLDIIISYGDRYRVVGCNRFWTVNEGSYFSYNGEYRMVSLLRSVTAINNPTVYFLTGHGESYYDPTDPESEMSLANAELYDLLVARGLTVRTLDISAADAVPDDCALLIINNPRTDFKTDPTRYDELGYVSDLEKLDRYLVTKQGAIMIAKDYAVELPLLESFLHEWGFDFGTTLMKDEKASIADEDSSYTQLIATYNTDKESYAYGIYGDYADTSSAPRTVFTNTGYITCSFQESSATSEDGTANVARQYISFLTSSESAKPYARHPETGEYVDLAGEEKCYDLAAVVSREALDSEANEKTHSYIFCVNSPDFLSNELLGNSAYANFDVVSLLIDNISRLEEYASMDLGGLSYNSSSYGGKQIWYSTLSYNDATIYYGNATDVYDYNYGISDAFIATLTVCVFAVPTALLVLGIVVAVRRRYK